MHFASAHLTRCERRLRPDLETGVVETPPAPPREYHQQDARDDRAREREPSRSSIAARQCRLRPSIAPSKTMRVARGVSTLKRKHSRGGTEPKSTGRFDAIDRSNDGRRAIAVCSARRYRRVRRRSSVAFTTAIEYLALVVNGIAPSRARI